MSVVNPNSKHIVPLLLCLYVLPVQAQPTASTAKTVKSKPAKTKLSAKDMQSMVNRILKETSELRELDVLQPVKGRIRSRTEVNTLFKRAMKRPTPTHEDLAAAIYLRQLGMAPASFDLNSYASDMMGESVAGAYDSRTKEFFTVEGVDPLQLQTVMAHELTHALQDQNFDLSTYRNWPKHDGDARFAVKSLVEGDATFTMMKYARSSSFRSLGMMLSTLKPRKADMADKAPRFLRDSMEFPYVEGMQFVSNLHSWDGWDAVSSAYENFPQSTEQILHVQKYYDGEAPIQVPLKNVTPALGKGWRLLDHDVNGEFGLFQVAVVHLNDDAAAARAAEGWGGDRYSIYQGPKKAALVVQDCIWDTDKDAQEWAQAYAKATTSRFKKKAAARGALQVWNAAPYGVWLERRGRRVLVLEGTVGAFNINTVLPVLWRNATPAAKR